MGPDPFGVVLASDSDDDSQAEEDSDEGLVLVDVLASKLSKIFVLAVGDAGVDDCWVNPAGGLRAV